MLTSLRFKLIFTLVLMSLSLAACGNVDISPTYTPTAIATLPLLTTTPLPTVITVIATATPNLSTGLNSDQIKNEVSDANPLLVPANVPSAYLISNLKTSTASFEIEYSDVANHKKIRLAIIIPNPPPPGDKTTQTKPLFRGVKALYQIDDSTEPTSHRILLWNEPGKWNTLGQGADYVPYMLSSNGLNDTEFWQFANALTKVNSLAPLPASNPAADANASILSLKSYYVALNNEDYKAAYDLVVRPNKRSTDDLDKFIAEQKPLAQLLSLIALKNQEAQSPKNSYVYEITLNLKSDQAKGDFSPGKNNRFVRVIKDNGVWRIAQVSSSPITN